MSVWHVMFFQIHVSIASAMVLNIIPILWLSVVCICLVVMMKNGETG
jgi:hypothetical protein